MTTALLTSQQMSHPIKIEDNIKLEDDVFMQTDDVNDDDDDEVVRTIDVYLSPKLSEQMYLMQ